MQDKYVVFRISNNELWEEDMFLPQYTDEEAAIKAALKMIAGEYGDDKEPLKDCEEELISSWFYHCPDWDVYIRQLRDAVP